MNFLFLGCIVFMISSTGLQAQMRLHSDDSRSTLSGRVHSPGSSDLNRLRIQIAEYSERRILSETNPNSQGSFEVPVPRTGVYELRVMSSTSTVIHSQSVTMPCFNELTIDLSNGSNGYSASSSVSLS